MKKNKKWIIPVIIILLIVCLMSALIISLELKSKNEISKVNLPQASAEQENNKSDEIQLNEGTTQNGNNTKDDNVETSMIWGCLWDETLQWLIDSGNKTNSEIKNSTSWGNYKNSTFEYTDTNENILTKLQNTSIKIPSGSTAYTKANNIYDMGGNVYEWTLETNNENARRCRGGDCGNIGSGGSAPYRYGYNPKITMNGIETRAYLYIK